MEKEPEKVYSVTDVAVEVQESVPPLLVVRAKGETITGGWEDAGLSRLVYVHPPEDGIQEYHFMATPPSGPATDAITPIEAEDNWKGYGDWVKGVRVSAEINAIERKIGES